MDPELAIPWIARLGAIGVLQSSIEWVSLRREIEPGGLFDPASLRGWTLGPPPALSGRRATIALLVARMGAASWTVYGGGLAEHALDVVALWLLVLTAILGRLRGPGIADTSDGMALHVFFALALWALAPGDRTVQWVVVSYVSACAVLLYSASGWSKAASRPWRSGEALRSVLATRAYGSPAVRRLFGSESTSRIASRALIIWECAFPCALFGDRALTVMLTAGFLFHVGVAWAMRLPRFVFPTIATFPAVACVSQAVGKLAF